MTDLGTLGGTSSEGHGINNYGQVVGRAMTTGSGEHAFLYSDGTMFDLNTLVTEGLGGATLHEASGINDSGQIVANGCNPSTCQAYRLDPIAGPAAITPVPMLSRTALGAMALLLLASGLLIRDRPIR